MNATTQQQQVALSEGEEKYVRTTDLGILVYPAHPMAKHGGKYRRRLVGERVHVEEFFAPAGEWRFLGTYAERMS